MKIKIGNKNIKINKVDGFFNRFKCMKFVFEPIKEGFYFEKQKKINTYFFCQNVDIVMTDTDNKILYMYPNLRTEKKIRKKKNVYYTYILPLSSCDKLNIGDTLNINYNKNEKNI